MADQATQTMVIAASADRIREALVDFEAYPTWARDLKGVTVAVRDADDRGREVTFRAAAMGRSTSYTLSYDYAEDPVTISWELLSGDIMRKLDGSYVLQPMAGDGEQTAVTYHLAVDLIVPLPGFVKRRAQAKIIHTALRQLRQHVER
ncbi:MAG: SRPBCC family protein [Acidimicrobiales bacterium]